MRKAEFVCWPSPSSHELCVTEHFSLCDGTHFAQNLVLITSCVLPFSNINSEQYAMTLCFNAVSSLFLLNPW